MSTTTSPRTGLTGNEQAIRTTVTAVEESWNRHDMDAFAELLTADAEPVHHSPYEGGIL